MAYTPDSLKPGDVKAIEAIKQNLLGSIDNSLAHIKILEDALKAYKQTVQETIDANIEYADIFNRWNEPDRHSTTYGLPGLMAATAASYDIEAIKKDNARMAVCKEKKTEAERQRDAYFKSIVKSFAALQSDLNNGVGDYNQRLFAFLEMPDKQVN
jgi:hypothetical protein